MSDCREQLKKNDARWGNRRVAKMYDQVNALRRAIRAGDPVATSEAWDQIEPHIDFVYQMAAAAE